MKNHTLSLCLRSVFPAIIYGSDRKHQNNTNTEAHRCKERAILGITKAKIKWYDNVYRIKKIDINLGKQDSWLNNKIA